MMRITLIAVPLVLAVTLFVLFATQMGRDPSFVPSALINKPVPDFVLPAIEGHDQPGFSTANLIGNGVSVVNVWASWCVPCRAEHPLMMRLGARNDVKLYGLNYNDAPQNARDFLAELGNPYYAIGADRERKISLDWGVYGIPETFVINNEGIITYKFIGPLSERSYNESLLPAIAEAVAAGQNAANDNAATGAGAAGPDAAAS
jgi:cytochrome c biogenesis protein CcmG, thiol:disulfide interchange protein DsbE